MEIKFKKIIPEAKTPLKTINIDAGFDLYATSIVENENYIEYLTGIAIEIPENYVGLIFPRSSVTKYDLMLKNSVGVIDASYRGEIRCRFHETKEYNGYIEMRINNTINKISDPTVKRNIYKVGERIAQLVILPLPKVELVEVDELSNTERGIGGFGHTGK